MLSCRSHFDHHQFILRTHQRQLAGSLPEVSKTRASRNLCLGLDIVFPQYLSPIPTVTQPVFTFGANYSQQLGSSRSRSSTMTYIRNGAHSVVRLSVVFAFQRVAGVRILLPSGRILEVRWLCAAGRFVQPGEAESPVAATLSWFWAVVNAIWFL